jgi:hypothetical protein
MFSSFPKPPHGLAQNYHRTIFLLTPIYRLLNYGHLSCCSHRRSRYPPRASIPELIWCQHWLPPTTRLAQNLMLCPTLSSVGYLILLPLPGHCLCSTIVEAHLCHLFPSPSMPFVLHQIHLSGRHLHCLHLMALVHYPWILCLIHLRVWCLILTAWVNAPRGLLPLRWAGKLLHVHDCRMRFENQRFIQMGLSAMGILQSLRSHKVSKLPYLTPIERRLWTLSFPMLCAIRPGIWSLRQVGVT